LMSVLICPCSHKLCLLDFFSSGPRRGGCEGRGGHQPLMPPSPYPPLQLGFAIVIWQNLIGTARFLAAEVPVWTHISISCQAVSPYGLGMRLESSGFGIGRYCSIKLHAKRQLDPMCHFVAPWPTVNNQPACEFERGGTNSWKESPKRTTLTCISYMIFI